MTTKDVKVAIANNGCKTTEYWYPEEIIPYIIRFLKEKFPNSIIRQQSDKADIVVLRDNDDIPVEIQKTLTRSNSNGVRIAYFEDSCRRQIEQNIEISGMCYFFLDENFLAYLKNISCSSISLNMKWLYEHYKERKVEIFSITRKGIIKPLGEEDLSILTKFVITGLDKNRHRIEYNVLKWKGYTTDEINHFYDEFKSNSREYNNKFYRWLYRKESARREIEFGNICLALGQLNCINNILNCSESNVTQGVTFCRDIGLFNKDGGNGQGKYARTSFTDKANIAQYLDGYKNNKELWEYIRIHPAETRIFYKLISGEYPNYLKDRKGQKSIEEAWG